MHMLLAKVYETQKNGPVGGKKRKKQETLLPKTDRATRYASRNLAQL